MATWGYGNDNGPATWVKSFPVAAGTRQSPIDIVPTAAKCDTKLTENPLTVNYSPEPAMELCNPGLSVKANIKSKSVIKGGPLEGEYKLEQFHLHWGSADKQGSEHTLNGKMFPAELHLVHYNATKYSSFGEAVDKPDGLAVFGIFLKISDKPHQGLKSLTDVLSEVQYKDKSINIKQEYNPVCLLPDNINKYWTYLGSLTTPPLCESVTWIVFEEPIEVSEDQMKAFRALCCGECGSAPIVDNYRPPLPLGNRQLRASFQ
ncbi:hypothetical protein LOTGIDRAFT_205401 [Lottia gigantea]|uniref:Carbonic anhydrase n=1 Tax=Lottia gigantea TaxID=225164 RepID=V4AHB6_LOTGI|nr:hypothetical protein LOTGIDRAFT_205401 [Lottia gigantea]ESO96312.1 hypothetical protein LOTGIDRAFT_205401 [Lottia gigantea]